MARKRFARFLTQIVILDIRFASDIIGLQKKKGDKRKEKKKIKRK